MVRQRERGNTSVVSKRYISVETFQDVILHPVNWPPGEGKNLNNGDIPESIGTGNPLPDSPDPRCISDPLLPISERKFLYVILYQVLFIVIVLRARTRVEGFLNFLLIRNQKT
jgi:hypothetical protein